ncbi:MAG: GNAT family N-acetyltransferase [Devosia sp.]
MAIRVIETEDREVWTRLWTGYLTFYETLLPAEVFESTWSRLFDPKEPVFGALSLDANGQPVGLVHYLFHRTTWGIADSCYLQDLYVDATVRGGGHGRALIEYVAHRAREAGSTRLYWNTHEANVTARRLYDAVAVRSGFIQYRKPLS